MLSKREILYIQIRSLIYLNYNFSFFIRITGNFISYCTIYLNFVRLRAYKFKHSFLFCEIFSFFLSSVSFKDSSLWENYPSYFVSSNLSSFINNYMVTKSRNFKIKTLGKSKLVAYLADSCIMNFLQMISDLF